MSRLAGLAMSLDRMGRAFLGQTGEGWLADVYFKTIHNLARLHQGDAAALLGQVLAHELGHLLLGPGHDRYSIMRSTWRINELAGMRQGWLQFSEAEQVRIKRKLRSNGGQL